MWNISKDFYCDYGHRVWTQHLEEKYCSNGDTSCKCKHLHGHTGKITIFLEGSDLERGMVTDFKHLGSIGDFIDQYFDHKMILDYSDPAFKILTNYDWSEIPTNEIIFDGVLVGYEVDSSNMNLNEEELEFYESFFFVDFVPTSENLAKFIFDIAKKHLKELAVVNQVSWKETPKSCATYTQ